LKKIVYPKEQILIVRPSLKAICNGNGPAAKLLSVLLYLYECNDKLKKGHVQINDKETVFIFCCTQGELVNNLCGEMDVKTLHDVAIPALLLLGYLDMEDQMKGNRYTLYIDAVNEALIAYTQGIAPLKRAIVAHLQLEKFLIQMTQDELEKFLIPDKRFFSAQLEKVLIAIREFSNCRRGPKKRVKVSSEAGGEENSQLESFLIAVGKFSNSENTYQPASEAGGGQETENPYISNRDTKISNRDTYKGAAIAATPTKREQKGDEKSSQKTVQRPLMYPVQEEKPATRRNRKKGEATNQPLELPDLSQPATQELIMQIADYHRGYALPKDKRNRDYKKACEQGATPLLTKRRPAQGTIGYTLEEIDLVFRLLRKDGKGGEEIGKPWLRDDEYINGPYTLDLWNLPKLMDSKLALIGELEAAERRKNATPSHRNVPPAQSDSQESPQGDEVVFWSELPEAWKDPLEHFESFYYMPVAKARQYGYKPHRNLTPQDENNVLARQRRRATPAAVNA